MTSWPRQSHAAVGQLPPSQSHAAVDLGTVKDGDGVPVAEAVAGVADVEEGLVVVRGQLGQPRHQLLHLHCPHARCDRALYALDGMFALIAECEARHPVEDLQERPVCHSGFRRLN